MAAPHVVDSVTTLAHELNIFLLYIPAKLTWRLQPLDAYVFQSYKNNLRAAYTTARCESASHLGVLSKAKWLSCVFEACVRTFANKGFAKAFAQTGLISSQESLSKRISLFVEAESFSPYTPTVPPSEDLQFMAGRGIDIPWDRIFSTYRKVLLNGSVALPSLPPSSTEQTGSNTIIAVGPPADASQEACPAPPAPMLRRLRSKTSMTPPSPQHLPRSSGASSSRDHQGLLPPLEAQPPQGPLEDHLPSTSNSQQ